jgi:LacI family transcriptional regulator, galactose operon repressor
MPVTLKHIADELGVSQMTVSRALRGVSRIKPQTRQMVRETAVRMGYQPIGGVMFPPAVRSGKGNHTLRLLLPTVGRRIGAEGGSWWLDRVVLAMRSRLELSNGRLAEQHFLDFADLLAEFERGRFHGVVLRQPLPNAWVKRLLEVGPVIYAVEFDHQLGVDSVYSNEHRSAAMLLDYLSRRGHRQIAWFGILDRHSPYHYEVSSDTPDESSVADRQAFSVHGARHAAWANIAHCQLVGQKHPLILVERDWLTQDLDNAVARGLERIMACDPRPTAVICSCDPVALALIEQVTHRGLRVPEDISVVSYGGSEEVKTANPSITSVEMPMETVGRVIPELVERRLADPQAVPISVQFQTTLYEGASVGVVTATRLVR